MSVRYRCVVDVGHIDGDGGDCTVYEAVVGDKGGVPVTVPFVGLDSIVNDSVSPSASVPINITPTGTSIAVVTLCGVATGAVLVESTLMVTVPVLLSTEPSFTVKVKLSEPVKLRSGV